MSLCVYFRFSNVDIFILYSLFKYIKKEDYEKNKDLLVLKQEEAKKQLEKYKKAEEVKILPNLKAYAIVAIKDELHVKEV